VVGRARYVPERGDLIWLDFDPQAGHEQAGRRPALVLSPKNYHRRSSLALVCPITSRIKGYPFEVPVAGLNKPSAVLADQLRSLDLIARQVKFIAKAEPDTVDAVSLLAGALILPAA
jgi:mRNA interferase MazF